MSGQEKKLKEVDSSSGEIPVEMFVGQELGSTGEVVNLNANDSRQNSLLNEAEVLALSYFSQVPDNRGGSYARTFIEEYRRHKMSLGGWRANQLIRLVAGSKGVASGKVIRKPGLLGRIRDPKWRENAELEGAEIIE